jgi:hypothetical protein
LSLSSQFAGLFQLSYDPQNTAFDSLVLPILSTFFEPNDLVPSFDDLHVTSTSTPPIDSGSEHAPNTTSNLISVRNLVTPVDMFGYGLRFPRIHTW